MANLQEFDSPRHLLDRAREHIDALAGEIKRFFEAQPYAPVVDIDPQTHQQVFKVRMTASLAPRLSTIAKDAATNLRDALDHAVYASAVALGVNSPEKTGFPFANDAIHLQGELSSWKFEHVPPEIKTFLMGLNPYPTGNDLLCGLNRLRNPNTHRVLVPVGFASFGTSVAIGAGFISSGQLGYSRWDPATQEVEYMRLSEGSQINANVSFAFDVVLGDIEFIGGKPVITTLNALFGEVERIVSGIEAETIRVKP